MKISVITVSYNSAATIGDTLDSVAMQSWPEIEHIVVDGASKDGTQDIVKSRGGRVGKFVSEPDAGIYDAMNKGLAMATGLVVAFLNADDLYADPEVISRVARKMTIGGLDAVFGDVAFFHPDTPSKLVRRYDSGRFSPARIAWGWMPAHPGLFLRREIYHRVGPFRTDYRIAGDFEFIARAFQKEALRYEHLPDIVVRMRMGGISTGGWINTIILNKEVLRACRENGISTNLAKILSKYPAKLLEFIRQ